MTKPVWPKHKPDTSLHYIVFDDVCRGFQDDQIISETCGLATHEMIKFYRQAVDLMIEKAHR